MGKKTKPVGATKGNEVAVPDEVAEQLKSLKDQGNKLFTTNQYSKALEAFDKALKLVPDGVPERSDAYLKKSACLIKLKRFKEAVKECNNALELQPNSSVALKRRAQAYEQQGLYKNAMSDLATINKTEGATEETREAERRLRDLVSGRKPSVAGNGATAASRAGMRPMPRTPYPFTFTAKCSLGDETRLIHMSMTVSYADLYAQVKAKFPTAGPFVLKFVDREGDLVTITQRNDVQRGLMELLASHERSMGGLNNPAKMAGLPPLRIQVVPVASVAEVPVPPEDEEAERQQLQARQQQQQQQVPRKEESAPGDVLELDQWLSDFLDLFASITNIDPFKPEHLQQLGQEEMMRAMHAAVRRPEAVPIFNKAAERFKESTCAGLLGWGNVHLQLAQKGLEDGHASGAAEALAEAEAAALLEMKEAEKRYLQALEFKDDYWEAAISMGQLEFERAKLAAGMAFKAQGADAPAPEAEAADANGDKAPEGDKVPEADKAAATNSMALLQEALQSVTAEKVTAAQPIYSRALQWFDRALGMAPTEVVDPAGTTPAAEGNGDAKDGDEPKAAEPAKAAAAGDGVQEPYSPHAQVLIMYGNVLYEWSQVEAHSASEWRATLDSAVNNFRAAGCSEGDIRTALKNHLRVQDLELGPDPEPEPKPEEPKAPEPEKVAEKAPEKAKGLPSLEIKKKGGK